MGSMIANFVEFHLLTGRRDDFIAASLANSRGSMDHPGCAATSIFPDPELPDVAYVFEVFTSQDAYDQHHAQPYYKRWVEVTAEMMAKPYELDQSLHFPGTDSFDRLRAVVASLP